MGTLSMQIPVRRAITPIAAVPRAATLAVVLLAGVVLCGWMTGIARLTDPSGSGLSMKANTAVGLLLVAVALWLLHRPDAAPTRRIVGRALAALAVALGALTLSQHVVGWNLGIDQLLVREAPGAAATASPGRMGPPASTSFVLLGTALLIIDVTWRRRFVPSQGLAMVVALWALVSIVGSLYGAYALFTLPTRTGVAPHTSVALLLLSVGILTARPDRGLMEVVGAAAPGGMLIRRLWLPALLFIVVFGWLEVWGQTAGFYSAALGTAIYAVCLIVLLAAIVWWNSRLINRLALAQREAQRARDVDRARAEVDREALLESERHARAQAERATAVKDEFLATLSHELRTPLNAVLGWIHILRQDAANPAKVAAGLAVIERNARVQAQLIAELLDMSRIISGKLHLRIEEADPVAIATNAIDAIRPAADAKGIRLRCVTDGAPRSMGCDPARLQQVMWNLLSNAVKFTPRDGHVELRLAQSRDSLRITVVDSGKGIAPAFIPYLFDRFRQGDASAAREHGGLGLGLAITRQLVEMHGGHVTASSEGDGAGATFTVELPLYAPAARASQHHGEKPRAGWPRASGVQDLNGVRVLVVDDEVDAREMVQRILADVGACVEVAASGEEALRRLATGRPDIIVSDIGMPVMDGFAFMEALRATGDRTPAMALTAYAREVDQERALRSGFQAHVTKPVDVGELLSAVAVLVGR